MKYALAGVVNLLAILATITGFVLAFVVDNGSLFLLSMVAGLPAVLVTSIMVSATGQLSAEMEFHRLHELAQRADKLADEISSVDFDTLLRNLDDQSSELGSLLNEKPAAPKVSDRRAAGASVPSLYAGMTAQALPRPFAPDPDLLTCHCRTCGRGPGVCGPMQKLRAAKARRELLSHLTDTDRDWLHRYGWDGS